MSKIKICGLRSLKDIEIINEAHPDYAGFIIDYPRSFRSLSFEEFESLALQVDKNICRVGVFVDENIGQIICLAQKGLLDAVQLHGSEDEAYIQSLKKQVSIPVIKAFIPKSEADLKNIENSPADFVLLDAGKGSGTSFNWSLCRNLHRPYFLAGGIGPDNVKQALELEPYALDVSSKVETDKRKDALKIKALMALIRKESTCQKEDLAFTEGNTSLKL